MGTSDCDMNTAKRLVEALIKKGFLHRVPVRKGVRGVEFVDESADRYLTELFDPTLMITHKVCYVSTHLQTIRKLIVCSLLYPASHSYPSQKTPPRCHRCLPSWTHFEVLPRASPTPWWVREQFTPRLLRALPLLLTSLIRRSLDALHPVVRHAISCNSSRHQRARMF